MATISRLQPGQIVWQVVRQKMGNTRSTRGALFSLKIIEVHIDADPPYVVASWNHNKPEQYYERSVKKWRVKKPEPKGTVFGMPSY